MELCLTSNLRTSTVPSYADHHFVQLHGALPARSRCTALCCRSHSGIYPPSSCHPACIPSGTLRCPVVLCTDDSGLFGTTLSHEYAIAAGAFGLRRAELLHLVKASFGYLFCSPEEVRGLRAFAAAAMEGL